jgi:glycosyltransferase involved in cell wall biosynthesis
MTPELNIADMAGDTVQASMGGLDQSPFARAPVAAKKIIQIAKHCGYGNGNVHVAVDLACVQADAGCDVIFVSGGGTFVPLLEQHGVHHISIEQDQRKPLSMLKAAFRLTAVARTFKPDVLHAHMMGSAAIGWIASRMTGVPLVTTVHNSFDSHSKLMRLGRRAVAVSVAERRLLVAKGFATDCVDVVMNAPVGSPRDEFMINDREFTLIRPCILAVCGLHQRKGLFDLLAACAMVFAEIPGWRLYIAGEGPDRELLEERANALRIAERVVFLGFVPSPRTLLLQCDIFTLCSYADPCSLVVGEARGASCPIVATAVGGTPEMLDSGRAGRLVPAGRPPEIAREFRSLMLDPQARAELRKASGEGAEIFGVHRLLHEYDDVYSRAGMHASAR